MTSSDTSPDRIVHSENRRLSEFRKLSTSTDCGPQEIQQSIPDGIQVKKAPYGHGVFASKFYPKDSIVYIGQQVVIPNEYAEFRLVIDGGDQTFLLNTETHSVQFNDTQRWLYLFDSFMNHSCDPTTISKQSDAQKKANQYQTVALKDIQPGDQITCDYNLFEYDCHGKVIEQCLCGSSDCIGKIAGYKYLSVAQQKKRVHLVDSEVLEALGRDPENKFYFIPDLKCPLDRVEIQSSGNDCHKVVAARNFQVGEVVYANESLIFPDDHSIVIEVSGKRKWLDNLIHTVNKGGGKREFYYFDSFQNHSCDPNTEMVYQSETAYQVVATKYISKADDITSDYESFDVGLDGTSFSCKCGSHNCRGIVKA